MLLINIGIILVAGLVNDNVLALVSPDICSINKDNALCNIKEYLGYLVKLTNEAFNNCATQFAAFGLRSLLELTILAVYVDIHHVYRNRSILEKLSLIQSFNLSGILGRSTFFRRIFIKALGSKDGRTFVDNVRTLYRTLSRYMHGPPTSCLVDATSFNPCTCVEELEALKDIVDEVIDLVKKIIYVWILIAEGSR